VSTVSEVYQKELLKRGYHSDPAQEKAVVALQRCADEWDAYRAKRSNSFKKLLFHPPLPRGVYLWGGVGRGKSFLMDCFYQAVSIRRKTRLHFHEFMREVQHELSRLQGKVNPLDELGKLMAVRFKLLCFDEFHITDITDAMILYRLLVALLDNGVGFITTSNFKPDELYPDGLHRDRILPAIELLNTRMEVINVDSGLDYRQVVLQEVDTYLTPLGPGTDAKMLDMFERLVSGADDDPLINIEGRSVRAVRRSGTVIWFDFKTLCEGLRSQNDYLEIAVRFNFVLLSGVPQMTEIYASAARRFTLLVDVFYDRHVKLIVSAAVAADQLYVRGPLAHEFPRTVSRLVEMRSVQYLAQARRIVDTHLT
jgi:cell division protein ZapE